MEKLRVLALYFLLMFSMLPLFAKVSAQETVQFSPLQEIVNNAQEGSTIRVAPDTYYGVTKINKTLTLLGDNAILDANSWDVAVIISASNVRLEGFTIRNTVRLGHGYPPPEISEVAHYPEMDGSGIYVYYASNVVITNVVITNCYTGIGFVCSSGQALSCKISNGTWGLMLEQCSNLKISTCGITWNADLENNNGGGVWLGCHTSTVTMQNCTISNNLWAITALPNTYYNEIHSNNFINNTHQVYIHPDATIVANWTGNYWSDYTGVDLFCGPWQNETGSDGIGDTPYRINYYNEDPYPLMTDPDPNTPPQTQLSPRFMCVHNTKLLW